MVRAHLQGVNTVRKRLADGTVRLYYYHRGTGKRLEGKPGSPDFLRTYAEAEKSLLDRLNGTFDGLVRDYTLSPEFGKLRASTQREYKRMLTKAEAKFGKMPTAALEDPRVRKDFMDWRAEVARDSGEREGDNRLSVISAMLTWARDNGVVFSNHVEGFKRLYHSNRSDKIWLPEHIEAFMAVASVEMQRAMILALHTGQRQADLRTLTWNKYDGTFISLRQRKTGVEVEVPCTQALKSMLDSMEKVATVILTTKTGRSFQKRYFAEQWEKTCTAAGITDLHFHDVRGTTITMLAEAGATVPQIASITGHSLKAVTSILEKYLARTRVLASEAITLFENAPSTKFANQLQTGTSKTTQGNAK